MEDESSAITQLGSLALGNLLQEIGVESDAGMDRLGLAPKPSTTALAKDQIYNERYEDDDDDELQHMGRGGQEDDEESERQKAQSELQKRYLAQGLASMGGTRVAVRGETDDFEDSDEDEDERALPPRALSPDSVDQAAPPAVKKEEPDDDRHLLSPGPLALPLPGPSIPRPPSPRSRSASPLALRLPTPPPLRDVKEFWPDFSPTKRLDFTDFFAAPFRKRRKVGMGKPVKLLAASTSLSSEQSDAKAAFENRGQPPSHLVNVAGDLIDHEKRLLRSRLGMDQSEAIDLPQSALGLAEIDDWESRIMLRPEDMHCLSSYASAERPVNRALHSDDWLRGVVWSSDQALHPSKFAFNSQLILDLNDEDMMIEEVAPEQDDQRTASLLASSAPLLSRRAAQAAASLDPLNMSNDGYYELSREQRQRIQRQTLGALVVQHTKIARKLQLPFYKTRLTKTEARSFHRPAMQFPINIPLSFSRVERAGGANGKKDKKRSKDPDEVLRSTRDLTLKEQGPFVLYEYSEEHPPIPSKIGMGSILVNYYRKKDAKDDHIPKLDLGEPFILEPNDESPFLKFGSVEPGEVQPTLYNNLIRAPLFRHQPATTDFLLVRVTTKNAVRYYLRDIKNLYTVGQNYPLAVIPGPHARLVTNAIRNRLIIVARRLVEQSKGHRIKIHRIMKYFPDQSELQMRQRLKEFMEYARKAGDPNQGYWRIRPNVPLPTDAEVEKLLPPEHICLAEAMQAGQRHLLDAGYTRTAEGADEDEDKEQGLDIEQLLAPWTTSKNFIMATQGKAMLRLHGEGDPTGRGEAFSFVRVSMKDVFYKAGEDLETRLAQQAEEERRSGHKYNVARQQQIYREEIDRIWNAQKSALSNPVPPELTPEEANPPKTPEPEDDEDRDAEGEDDEDVKATVGSKAHSNKVAPGKVLRIRRQVNGRWQTEIVRVAKVIESYITARQRLADEQTTTDALVPTGDAALDAARRKRLEDEIASRKKNQERRLARRNAKAVAEGRALPGAYKKLMADKPTTSRRCGRCGQVGHMMSNRSCPLWGQVPAAAAPGSVSSASGSRAMGLDISGGASASSSMPGTPMAAPTPPASAGGFPHMAMAGSGASTPIGPSVPGSFFGVPPQARGPAFGTGTPMPSTPAAGGGGGKLKLKLKPKGGG